MNRLKMVVIVEFRRPQEWEVIAAVVHDVDGENDGEPHPSGGHVRTTDQWTQKDRKQIDTNMLNWMCVNGDQANGSRPFVVDLVDVRVEHWMVSHSV